MVCVWMMCVCVCVCVCVCAMDDVWLQWMMCVCVCVCDMHKTHFIVVIG